MVGSHTGTQLSGRGWPIMRNNSVITDDLPEVIYIGDDMFDKIKEKKIPTCGWRMDSYDAYTDTALYKAMQPLFVSLKLLGLHHSKKYGSVEDCMKKVECNSFGRKQNLLTNVTE